MSLRTILAALYEEETALAGQLNPAWAQEDPDLHWVRHDSRFWALVGEEPPAT